MTIVDSEFESLRRDSSSGVTLSKGGAVVTISALEVVVVVGVDVDDGAGG